MNLQASLVAERPGRWVLARRYAETCKDLCEASATSCPTAGCSTTSPASTTCSATSEVAIEQLRGGIPDLRRRGSRGGGRLRPELAGRDPPRARRARGGRGDGPPGARAPRGPSRPRPGDRDGAARARPQRTSSRASSTVPRTCSPPSTRASLSRVRQPQGPIVDGDEPSSSSSARTKPKRLGCTGRPPSPFNRQIPSVRPELVLGVGDGTKRRWLGRGIARCAFR